MAACWSPAKPRTVAEFLALPEEDQGKWLEWTAAQELFRRRCIAGEETPELLLFWQGKEHELDFVCAANSFVEIERGTTSALDFSWFERVMPGSRLVVVSDASYEARSVRGIRLEEFLRGA